MANTRTRKGAATPRADEPAEHLPPMDDAHAGPSAPIEQVVSSHTEGARASGKFVYDDNDEGLDYRRRYRGLIGVASKVPIRDRSILSLVYTPGVAAACMEINQDPLRSYDLTCRGNTVAILTDGSDLFGSEGGPVDAALPIAEARSVIFKTFAGIDAFPITLSTTDIEEIVETGISLSPTFGALCLDDISSPRAFTIGSGAMSRIMSSVTMSPVERPMKTSAFFIIDASEPLRCSRFVSFATYDFAQFMRSGR